MLGPWTRSGWGSLLLHFSPPSSLDFTQARNVLSPPLRQGLGQAMTSRESADCSAQLPQQAYVRDWVPLLSTALRQRRASPIGQEVRDVSPLHLSLACTSVCSSALPKSRGKAGCLYYPQDASAVFENRLGQACPGRRRLYKFPMCADWEEGPLLPASLLSTSSICRRLAMGHHPPRDWTSAGPWKVA